MARLETRAMRSLSEHHRAGRPAAGLDWQKTWVDTSLSGTSLLTEASGAGGSQLLFVTEASYDFVHPVHAAGVAPYVASLSCACGAPNPDGECVGERGKSSGPYVPLSAGQRRFLREGLSGVGGDARSAAAALHPGRPGTSGLDEDPVAAVLTLRGAPRRLSEAEGGARGADE